MASISQRRQKFANQIRKKRRANFMRENRQLLMQNQQQLPQLVTKLFSETLSQMEQLKAIQIGLTQCLKVLTESQLKGITELCFKYLDRLSHRGLILNLLTQVTHSKKESKALLCFQSEFKIKVIEILKNTKNTQEKIDCIYIYGNLIVDIGINTQQDFKMAREILNIINKQEQRTQGSNSVLESLIWVMQNTTLIFIKTNKLNNYVDQKTQAFCKQNQRGYGRYCMNIICQMLDKQICQYQKSVKMTLQQDEDTEDIKKLSFIISELQLFELISLHKIYDSENPLYYFDSLLIKYYRNTDRFDQIFTMNILIVRITDILLTRIGFTEGVELIISKICKLKLKSMNVIGLISRMNSLDAYRMHRASKKIPVFEIQKFRQMMNESTLPIVEKELQNHQCMLQKKTRDQVLDYLISCPQYLLRVKCHLVFGLLEKVLSYEETQHVLKGLHVLRIKTTEAEDKDTIDLLKDRVMQTNVGSLLISLQMNKNKDVHEQATQIIQVLNLEN